MIGFPEGVWLGLTAINLLLVAIINGQPRTDKWCFPSTLCNAMFLGWLLWWGGFFA